MWVRVRVPSALVRYIVPKGYVAVDGTSLTVCEVHHGASASASASASATSAGSDVTGAASATGSGPSPGRYSEPEPWFTFMLIAYTQKYIIVPLKRPGDRVNIEVDVLGKYVDNAATGLSAQLETTKQQTAATAAQLTELSQSLTQSMARLEQSVTASIAALDARVAKLEAQATAAAAAK